MPTTSVRATSMSMRPVNLTGRPSEAAEVLFTEHTKKDRLAFRASREEPQVRGLTRRDSTIVTVDGAIQQVLTAAIPRLQTGKMSFRYQRDTTRLETLGADPARVDRQRWDACRIEAAAGAGEPPARTR